jgi:hypothetical protein
MTTISSSADSDTSTVCTTIKIPLLPEFPKSTSTGPKKNCDNLLPVADCERLRTDEEIMVFIEHAKMSNDFNSETAEAASNVLNAILNTYPVVDGPLSSSDNIPTSLSEPNENDIFVELFDYSIFSDQTLDSEFEAGSSTLSHTSHCSRSQHLSLLRAGRSSQISKESPVGDSDSFNSHELFRPAVWKAIAGDTIFYEPQGWKWEGRMDAPDNPWAIESSEKIYRASER